MELPNIKYGGIMGNKRGHVKGNHPQKPKRLLDLAKEILRENGVIKRPSVKGSPQSCEFMTFASHKTPSHTICDTF